MKIRKSRLIILTGLIAVIFGIYIALLQITGNFHTVIKGEVYRSAQLGVDDINYFSQEYGIKSILNLRGDNAGEEWYDSEVKESAKLGITHINFKMKASRELTRMQALELIEVMRHAPKPMLIHCRGGADRTGLAAAFYIAALQKGSEFNAELQLSLLYGHIPLWFAGGYAMNETFEMMETALGFFDS